MKFEIKNESQQRVLRWSGEIDSSNVAFLDEQLTMLARTSVNIGSELLDFRQVKFMSVGAWVRIETYIEHAPHMISVEPSQAVTRVARAAAEARNSNSRYEWVERSASQAEADTSSRIVNFDLRAVAPSGSLPNADYERRPRQTVTPSLGE